MIKDYLAKTDDVAVSAPAEPVALEDGLYNPEQILGNQDQVNRLNGIVNRLGKSATGKNLLEFASSVGYKLTMGTGMTVNASCDPSNKTVLIRENAHDYSIVSTLAHELRHAWQFENDLGVKPAWHDTATQMLRVRAIEADAESTAAIVSKELEMQGDKKVWHGFVKNGPKIAVAFDKAAQTNDFSTPEGKNKIRTAAFEGWYNDNYIRGLYEEGIADTMDNYVSANNMDFPGYKESESANDLVGKLCVDNTTGQNYFTDSPGILNSDKYNSVSASVLKRIYMFFDERKKVTGLDADPSVQSIQMKPDKEKQLSRKDQLKEIAQAFKAADSLGLMPTHSTLDAESNIVDAVKSGVELHPSIAEARNRIENSKKQALKQMTPVRDNNTVSAIRMRQQMAFKRGK